MTSILELCTGLPTQEVAPGTVLLREGERTGRLYFLISGRIDILKNDVPINTVTEPGAVFGEISVLLNAPHMATVRAQEDSKVHVVEHAEAFLQSHSKVNYHLSKLLAQRLQGVTGYLVDLKKQFADQGNHLAMVDNVLESLVHQQSEEFSPGSDRDSYDQS